MISYPEDDANRFSCQKSCGKYSMQITETDIFTSDGVKQEKSSRAWLEENLPQEWCNSESIIAEPILQDLRLELPPGTYTNNLVYVPWVRRTPKELEYAFARVQSEWQESEAKKALEQHFAAIIEDTHITKVVAFAIGSLHSVKERSRRASNIQLAVLLTIIECVNKGKESSQHVRCYLQEPFLSKLDQGLLESRGITVIDDPKGFELVDQGTLVYMQNTYAYLYCTINKGPWPAVMISDPLESFVRRFDQGVAIGSNRKELIELEMMAGYYKQEPFEHMLVAEAIKENFRNINVYWRSSADMTCETRGHGAQESQFTETI
ncbi:MAG: hypothetical protein Q9220_000122 [cf. Caloplaca sp. 1 TL-2023]